ncbi:MAG: hypothetical protein ACR2PC_02340 [Tsuneonella suprasediminis]
MPKSLENQGYDRGAGASHIAALYLALDLSPAKAEAFFLPALRDAATGNAKARECRC